MADKEEAMHAVLTEAVDLVLPFLCFPCLLTFFLPLIIELFEL